MKPSKDILNRILVPYKHDEFPRDEPRCPTCGVFTVWCGDTTAPPFGDLHYCPSCDCRYIQVSIRDAKRMLKHERHAEQEIDFTCLLKLDPTWPGCHYRPSGRSRCGRLNIGRRQFSLRHSHTTDFRPATDDDPRCTGCRMWLDHDIGMQETK